MKKLIVFFIILLPLHKAYAWEEGNCYKPRSGKAKHLCATLKEGKKILADLEIYKRRVEKEIPNLKQRLQLREETVRLLQTQLKKGEKAIRSQERAIDKAEKTNVRLNSENRKVLVSAEQYKKEAEKAKRERWTWLAIGVGTGIVVTAAVVTAIALYAKPINLQVTAK